MNTFIHKMLFSFLLASFFLLGSGEIFAQEAQTVEIKSIEGMQFDQVRIWAKPGSKLTLVMENTDKEDHNLVVTRPGARQKVVNAALRLGVKGQEMNYIPKSDEVLWAIPVLAAGEKDSVTFTTPDEEGIYPYVCTFPGHGNVMYGALYVSEEKDWGPQAEDTNIPESRRK